MGFYIQKILLELKKTNPDGTEEELDDTNEKEEDYGLDSDEPGEDEEDNPSEENDESDEEEANYELDSDNDDDMEMNDDNAPSEDGSGEDDNASDDDSEGEDESDNVESNDDDEEANYDLDSGDDADESNDDTSSTDLPMDSTDDSNDPDAKIKEIEKSIGSLSQEQLNLQNINLKKQYLELYNNCGNFIERLNDINKNEDNEEEVNYSIQTILDLKKMIYEYLINVYDSKTFTENAINYTEYLVTLNSINKLLKELNVKK